MKPPASGATEVARPGKVSEGRESSANKCWATARAITFDGEFRVQRWSWRRIHWARERQVVRLEAINKGRKMCGESVFPRPTKGLEYKEFGMPGKHVHENLDFWFFSNSILPTKRGFTWILASFYLFLHHCSFYLRTPSFIFKWFMKARLLPRISTVNQSPSKTNTNA